MSRVISLIDGFNLYHAIDTFPNLRKYKWLNLRKLSECFIHKDDELRDIIYFSAYARWDPGKFNRHKIYIKALETANITVLLSEFRRTQKICKLCKKKYKTYEEKETDVHIAINLFQKAIDDKYDKALIISADSDLIPAIRAVKNTFPDKIIHIVIPIGRRAELLKQVADEYSKIKKEHLESCQFEDVIDISGVSILRRPVEWR